MESGKGREKPLIVLKEIAELKTHKRNSIIYENQQEEHEDHMSDQITDAFVLPSTTNTTNLSPKEESIESKGVVIVPLEKKFTESFQQKVKKKGSKLEGSPKSRPKTHLDQASKESKNTGEAKNNESFSINAKSPLEPRKGESYEKKVKDGGESNDERLRAKSVMKATESFLKKITGDRKKSTAEGLQKKKDSGNDERLEEIPKKKELAKEENDDYLKYAKRKYKIYTPVKTVDFNY